MLQIERGTERLRALPVPTPAAGTLPLALTSFVGRQHEVAEARQLLATTRLLTLTGPGGSGKTRLALVVAEAAAADYPDGVWLVELAALSDPALVPEEVARVLGVRERAGVSLIESLARTPRTRRALLVLDNCEHLLGACADLAFALLRACPHLHILATSQAVLGVGGEVAFPVPPLPLPAPGALAEVERLAEVESVRLFVERARAVRPGFALTPANAAAVAAICARLDGLPLAIELAAARLRLLTPEQVAARLTDRFCLLVGGDRTATPRQRTLWATLDWSHDLLHERDRRLFERLAVFAGGFTLEAVEAVCADEPAVGAADEAAGRACPTTSLLDGLGRLVERSLVVAEPGADGTIRYRLLESPRQYGAERLLARGEATDADLRRRHARYYLGLAEEVGETPGSPHDQSWLGRLEREHDNLRAALAWALEHDEDDLALRLAGALAPFWYRRGHVGEGRRWLERALARADATPTPAGLAVRLAAGLYANLHSDYERARTLLEEALASARAVDDRRAAATALMHLAFTAFVGGDARQAAARQEEALGLLRALGDTGGSGRVMVALADKVWALGDVARAEALVREGERLLRAAGRGEEVAVALTSAGHLARARGDHDRAVARYEEALALRRERGDIWGMAAALAGLAAVALAEGDTDRAAALHGQALRLRREHGDRGGISLSLDGLAAVAAARGEAALAARLLGAAATLRSAIGMPTPPLPVLTAELERTVATVRRRLGAAAHAAAWAEGQALAEEEAVTRALALATPAPRPMPRVAAAEMPAGLTERQIAVAARIARGESNRAIAAALSVSERTVEGHVANLLGKLGFESRSRIAAWAVEQGLTGIHAPAGADALVAPP